MTFEKHAIVNIKYPGNKYCARFMVTDVQETPDGLTLLWEVYWPVGGRRFYGDAKAVKPPATVEDAFDACRERDRRLSGFRLDFDPREKSFIGGVDTEVNHSYIVGSGAANGAATT